MKKWVIYTALFGDYDHLVDPQVSLEEFDLICFTDQSNLNSTRWRIVKVPEESTPLAQKNREFKLLPHQFLSEYEVSIYIDVNIRLLQNPKNLILENLNGHDALLSKHLLRDCIYEESKECVIFKKASYKNTIDQLTRYQKAGMPKNFGLFENGILIRRHNSPILVSLMEQWWKEYLDGSRRDQLSWPYILWKNQVSFPVGSHGSNDGIYFKIFPHNHEKISRLAKMKLSLTIRCRRIWYSMYPWI